MPGSSFHTSEDVLDSVESLQRTHGKNLPFIYWMLLLITSAAVTCLPLVKVDTSVGAPGHVRPAIERLAVHAGVSGRIEQLLVADNQTVKQGDILLVIDSAALDARLMQVENETAHNNRALHDLNQLLARDDPSDSAGSDAADARVALVKDDAYLRELPRTLRTPQYVRQHALLASEVQRLQLQHSKSQHELSRYAALYAKRLISEHQFDQQRYEVRSVEREIELIVQQALSRWQSDQLERELRKVELETEAKQLLEQKELYTVRAPIGGTALGFVGLHPGLFLPSDRSIGEISPAGGLQADVYVSSRDVGFVHGDQVVKLQIDAYPYTEWGMLRGRVRDISRDVVQFGQQFAFKVVVDLDSTHLASASGAVVEIRRGMAVNARFLLEKRSLFSVLYGKMSESLDPRATGSGN